MSKHFNDLTPAQAERLAILAEECGEVIQVVGKILRHGYNSVYPVTEEHNTTRLEQECGDVRAAIIMLCDAGDIVKQCVHDAADRKLVRVKQYMHHDGDPK